MVNDAEAASRRDTLLEQVIVYVLENGLAGLSLRPLAAALDTSPRMLLYHFGSKERLLSDALEAIEVRQRDELGRLIAAGDAGSALGHYWRFVADPRHRAFLRLRHELSAMRLVDPEAFPAQLDDPWLDFIDDAFRAERVPEAQVRPLSTYVAAFVNGCESMLLATGDLERTSQVFAMFEQDLARRVSQLAGGRGDAPAGG